MQGPEKNSYKEFDKEKELLRLENSPPPPPSSFPSPPPHNFSNGPSLTEIRVILRHEYRTSIKTALKNGSPMLQRNVWTLQQNLIFASSNKSNSACRPLFDKLHVTELRSKRFFTVSFLPLAAKQSFTNHDYCLHSV